MIPNLDEMKIASRRGQREFCVNIWRDRFRLNNERWAGSAHLSRFHAAYAANNPPARSFVVTYRIRIRLKPGVRL